MLRLGKKLSAPRDEFVLIRNISAGGVRAEVFSNRKVGERLTFDLGNEDPLSGKVVLGLTRKRSAGVALRRQDRHSSARWHAGRTAGQGRARAPGSRSR